MQKDRAGDSKGAIAAYKECLRKYSDAIKNLSPNHADDGPKLEKHRDEISERIKHLESLRGQASTIPVEDQIKAVQLGMKAMKSAQGAGEAAGGVKTLGACAALGAGAGFLVLGGIVGPALAVVGGAAAAAGLATRSDAVGDAARSAGSAAVHGAEKASELNQKHKVVETLTECGKKAVERAKEVDEKHGIREKLMLGAQHVAAKASEIEQKHHVTDKVASGLGSAFSKLSSKLDKKAGY